MSIHTCMRFRWLKAMLMHDSRNGLWHVYNCMMVESSVIFPSYFLHVLLDIGMQDGENQER